MRARAARCLSRGGYICATGQRATGGAAGTARSAGANSGYNPWIRAGAGRQDPWARFKSRAALVQFTR